jgi:hypothetical protein
MRRIGKLPADRGTHTALEEAGYKAILWRDDTEVALDWFKTVMGAQRQDGLNLGLVARTFGPWPAIARNLRENRLVVLSAVLIRD